MKKLLFVVVCVTCFFAIGLNAQEYPTVEDDGSNIVLTIPYLEWEDDEGETRALSAELVAESSSGDVSFSVDYQKLVDIEVDTPQMVQGEGACSSTTNAQLLACRADTQDDYFEAQAKCFNESDPVDQAECFSEATAERSDALEECGDIEESHANLCAIFGEGPYDPDLDDITFVSVDAIAANPNPYFPLIVGNVWVYESEEETITVTVLDQTKDIEGIEAIVVRDVVEEDGEVIEDTSDWYAQDEDGNVWYMGELSLNYEDGELSDVDGSWKHGTDGAKAGILFRGMPVVDEVLRQEYLIGEAEDIGQTVSLENNESTDSGFACSNNCLETLEWTPLEPDGEETKIYLPGTGLILEINLEDDERVELVDFTPGS
ncbi:MAG: hypothetical protein O2971_15565 [Proteobacteria bacterium]|nr:hypothetical protein [Pseudomonadota bacterium]